MLSWPRAFVFFLLLLLVATSACSIAPTKPQIVLNSPPHGSQFREGEEINFQSTATDSGGVARVELAVDGTTVRTDSPPASQTNFTLVQKWQATPGTHNISVRAISASNAMSDPAVITISVLPAGSVPTVAPPVPTTASSSSSAGPTNTPVPTAVPPTATSSATTCTNASGFVADVTVPDGTLFAPDQAFNKIWRIKNTGTCSWNTGYQFVYASGDAMATTTSIAVPPTAAGATADLLVAMVAPAAPGLHTGTWRLKGPDGKLFGTSVKVVINVLGAGQPPAATPGTSGQSGCSGSPNIESFTASPSSIAAGSSTTLSYGLVSNADSAEIDNDIGGIETPGSKVVSPGSSTTYTLIARCGSATKTAQVTVIVTNPAVNQPDLFVSEFSLNPATPVQSGGIHVRIGVYNQGTAAAGTFAVQWFAGTNYPSPACSWTVDGLPPSGGRILECDRGAGTWASPYATITTRAIVDSANAINESNENNNIRDLNIQVLGPSQPDLYVSAFNLNPNPPNHTANVQVSVTVYNQGNAAAGPFKVEWWAGSNYPAPACTWNVASMAAHGGQVLTCTKGAGTWGSFYANITTRVKVDPDNGVAESNEGNNVYDLAIKVN